MRPRKPLTPQDLVDDELLLDDRLEGRLRKAPDAADACELDPPLRDLAHRARTKRLDRLELDEMDLALS